MNYSLEAPLEPNDVDKIVKKTKGIETYAKLTGLGFEILAYVLLALAINNWLEKKINTRGLSLALLVFLAMGLWIYRVITTLNELEKNKQQNVDQKNKN